MRAARVCLFLSGIGVLQALAPAPAFAQWYLGGYLGGNRTQNATVSVRVPSDNISLKFHDVRFAAESNQGRRYYGLRLGRFRSPQSRFGFELEFIHLKMVGDTSQDYDVTFEPGSATPASGVAPMNLLVREYRMTHGVNLALVNVVMRRPIGSAGGPVDLMLRAGTGVTFPHAETTVGDGVVHGYEFGGPGVQGAAGLQFRFAYGLAAIAEYKLTYVRPTIDIAGGDSTTSAVAHHLMVGVTIPLSR